jgi:hypothetical protein
MTPVPTTHAPAAPAANQPSPVTDAEKLRAPGGGGMEAIMSGRKWLLLVAAVVGGGLVYLGWQYLQPARLLRFRQQ